MTDIHSSSLLRGIYQKQHSTITLFSPEKLLRHIHPLSLREIHQNITFILFHSEGFTKTLQQRLLCLLWNFTPLCVNISFTFTAVWKQKLQGFTNLPFHCCVKQFMVLKPKLPLVFFIHFTASLCIPFYNSYITQEKVFTLLLRFTIFSSNISTHKNIHAHSCAFSSLFASHCCVYFSIALTYALHCCACFSIALTCFALLCVFHNIYCQHKTITYMHDSWGKVLASPYCRKRRQ